MAAIAKRLKDFYQGDSKTWALESEQDLTGSVFVFRMAASVDAASVLEIEGVLDPPIPGLNYIHRVTFTITSEESATIPPGNYMSCHRWKTQAGTVTTFLQAPISVLQTLPRGEAVI